MSDEMPKAAYGEPHINFAQALVQLARDYGVQSFHGRFRLDWDWRETRDKWSDGDVQITWAQGRHGDDSRIGLSSTSTASVPEIAPNSDRVPPLTYAAEGNFYETSTRKGKGQAFYDRWVHRIADFPQSREESLDRAGPDTRAWIEKRFPA